MNADAIRADEEARAERRRASARDRKRRQRERERAVREEVRAELETAPAPVEPVERPAGGTKGRVLGVYGLGSTTDPFRFDVLYERGEREPSPDYATWLSIPYERALKPAVLVTPIGRYSYDPEDEHDIARCAALAVGDLPDANENALRSALSKVERGRVFTFGA